MKLETAVPALLLLVSLAARALGPHEILLIANRNSEASAAVAGKFVKLRSVPTNNVVFLDLPERLWKEQAQITPADFTEFIWEPVLRAARERGVEKRVLAWVYSVDFPVRVATTPPMSITGLTFVKNRPPDGEAVDKALYASPLFAGPSRRNGPHYRSQSFDTMRGWLGEDMPIPCIMLGYTGKNGNSEKEIEAYLASGTASDGTRPSGTVYFVTSQDIRSQCRQWQFPAASIELFEMGVASVITNAFPAGKDDVMGLMIGAADVKGIAGNRYMPGCMAEHLTSMAAVFDAAGQTKLSAWLGAGATASAGTVSEPRAMWPKFPSASFFLHYAAGCNVIESFYQSIRCPLQTLIVGEPLASPWVPKASVKLTGLDGGATTGVLKVGASVQADSPESYVSFLFLVDGRPVDTDGRTNAVELLTGTLGQGSHSLRCVAYRAGLVRNQVFAEKTFVVGKAR